MSPFDANRSSSILPQLLGRLYPGGSRATGSTGKAPEVGRRHSSEDQALLFTNQAPKSVEVPAKTERDARTKPQDVLFPPPSWKSTAISPTVMLPPSEQVGKHRHGPEVSDHEGTQGF